MQRQATLWVGLGFTLVIIIGNASLFHFVLTAAIILVMIHIWNDAD